jgi:hypothetical protein
MRFWLWILTGLSIIGTVANIQKLPWCFGCWVVTNSAWAIHNFRIKQYQQMVLFIVYLGLAIWGLCKWS